ncbi:NUDIX domain-containing protein [Patescibacteria group bacterium]|nr:NUDIX domain-containing protein [Patescibacteria group bacterium]
MEANRPKVGVGCLVVKDGLVLIGERISSFGKGAWQLPGGHLEHGESFEGCAIRELEEETGLTDVVTKGVVSISNDIEYEKHYVTIGVLLEWKSGEPVTAEPDKSKGWYWCDPNELPENIFPHSRRIVENWLKGTLYTNG